MSTGGGVDFYLCDTANRYCHDIVWCQENHKIIIWFNKPFTYLTPCVYLSHASQLRRSVTPHFRMKEIVACRTSKDALPRARWLATATTRSDVKETDRYSALSRMPGVPFWFRSLVILISIDSTKRVLLPTLDTRPWVDRRLKYKSLYCSGRKTSQLPKVIGKQLGFDSLAPSSHKYIHPLFIHTYLLHFNQ